MGWKRGNPGCPCCDTLCVTVWTLGCPAVASIVVKDGTGATVASGTTNATTGQVCFTSMKVNGQTLTIYVTSSDPGLALSYYVASGASSVYAYNQAPFTLAITATSGNGLNYINTTAGANIYLGMEPGFLTMTNPSGTYSVPFSGGAFVYGTGGMPPLSYVPTFALCTAAAVSRLATCPGGGCANYSATTLGSGNTNVIYSIGPNSTYRTNGKWSIGGQWWSYSPLAFPPYNTASYANSVCSGTVPPTLGQDPNVAAGQIQTNYSIAASSGQVCGTAFNQSFAWSPSPIGGTVIGGTGTATVTR